MARTHADKYEGEDVIRLLELAQSRAIIDDELTKGRIRTIFVQVVYGKSNPKKVADYYGLPEQLIKDIARGKVFRDITRGM